MELKEKIRTLLLKESYNPMLYEELFSALNLKDEEIPLLHETLLEMEQEGQVIVTRKKRYGAPERMNLVVGRIQGNKRGFGFLIPDNGELGDFYISADHLKGALNNDRVIARPLSKNKVTKKMEAEVIRILERANATIVGTFERSRNFGFVTPDDTKIHHDIFIALPDFNGAQDESKVVVEITKWPEGRRSPEGRIIEVLGQKDDVGTDILSIIKQYGLSEEFPEKVELQAAEYPEKVPVQELKKRRDLRDHLIVTIDGDDAKDLDDAVSLEILDDGNFLLGVHIADVSQYVTEHSPLDKEALKRGTSVYLVDRVVPMLPRKLSNGICSLNPGVDRLTLSCEMIIDRKGKTVSYEIFESVIKTTARMTYANVNKILDGDVETCKKYEHLITMFHRMDELKNILFKKRVRRGSIEFDFPETKIKLDEIGKPIEIKPYDRGISEQIIEEFMLVCNETIAEDMFWKEYPFVYRVHEDPDAEKIADFNAFIYHFGYSLKGGTQEIHPKAMQKLLEQIKGKKEERIITTMMLRSLRKARYAPESLGHFGLAAKYYCHFTSPIRRYPDLIIHRIIKEELHGLLNEKRIDHYNAILTEVADQSSIREREADEAERETDNLKMAEYMKDRIGEQYDGIISGIKSFGMFVQLENTIEGMIRLSSMEDDYYIFDEEHYQIIGERLKKKFKVGDAVKVEVAGASIADRNVDFQLIQKIE